MTVAEVIVRRAILGLLLLCTLAWLHAFYEWKRGRPLVAQEPLRPVPWRIGDLLVVWIFSLFVPLLLIGAANWIYGFKLPTAAADYSASDLFTMMSINMLGSVISTGSMLLWLRTSHRTRSRELGLSLHQVWSDLKLGVRAFVMIVPLVLQLQFLLTRWFPSEHPIQKLIASNPTNDFFLIAIASAVIVAPLAEEFFFRVVLQGWLQRVSLFGLRGELKSLDEPESIPTETQATRLARWPIVASAAVFAIMHWGHGPDPIPLFVLALALGYLYQRTGRIWPGWLVHTLLNLWSMGVLYLQLRS